MLLNINYIFDRCLCDSYIDWNMFPSSDLRHNVFVRVHAARGDCPERHRVRRLFDDDG
jgi:hypothetical protein